MTFITAQRHINSTPLERAVDRERTKASHVMRSLGRIAKIANNILPAVIIVAVMIFVGGVAIYTVVAEPSIATAQR